MYAALDQLCELFVWSSLCANSILREAWIAQFNMNEKNEKFSAHSLPPA